MIIWFTGLPCSGKSTLAAALIERIDDPLLVPIDGRKTVLLDGDELRSSEFSKGIGFTKEEREQHLLRVGYMAQRLNEFVPFVICTFVSPYEDTRKKLPVDIMIHVKASPSTCAARDVKGMWAKAKAGEIKNFTGYDAPYEHPVNPDLTIVTDCMSVEVAVDHIVAKIMEQYAKDRCAGNASHVCRCRVPNSKA